MDKNNRRLKKKLKENNLRFKEQNISEVYRNTIKMWQPYLLLLLCCYGLYVDAIKPSPPLITKQPQSDEILFQVAEKSSEDDKPFLIECEAEGEPAPTYRWIKNGKPFEWAVYDDRMTVQPGRGTLVITKPREEDIGQYQCFATNEYGTASSNSVFVRKAELNSFKEEIPQNMTALEGKPFRLQCQPPDGWPKPVVHWMIMSVGTQLLQSINNSRMTLDPEGNLWMSNVTRLDSSSTPGGNYFYYICTASSPIKNELKLGNRVLLDVIQAQAPGLNKYPVTSQYVSRKNQEAINNRRLELFCIFGGTPLPQVVWTKNGAPIQWNDRVTQGHYGKSLIIDSIRSMDEGEYTCEASNGVGQAQTYSMNVAISALPFFTREPELVTAAEEEDATFYCEAQGKPEPNIKWIFNGKPIAQAPPNSRRIVTTNSITVKNLVKSDTGNYGCNATNNLGYVYRDVYLNVLAVPPEIEKQPGIEATVDRRNITLTCKVFGAPKPEVKWIKDGNNLSGGRFRVMLDGSLEITDVTFTDAGDYQCYASNKFGSKTANGTLIVKRATYIIDKPQDYEVIAGTPATFRCSAVADTDLEMRIDWYKDGEIIDHSDSRFIKANDNSLQISKTIELDSGEYTCVASTDLDRAEATATLIVQDVPNPPKLTKVECFEKSATVSWISQGDNRSPILFYTIQYNTSFTPKTWDVAYEKVPSSEYTYTVGMSPWANYTFRVIAWNKIDQSGPSDHSQVCTTQEDVPYKNPENVEGKGTEPNNMVIRWTPMAEIEHNAPNFHYRVSWQKDLKTDNWQHEEIKNWTQSSLVITDTPVFQRYRIKVIALNRVGQANVLAREVIGYSGEDKPIEAPGNFTVIQVTGPEQVLLGWTKVANESVKGHFKGYKIEVWSEEDPEQKREIQIKSNANRTLVNKLIPASKNFARVMVYNGRYNGPVSNTVSFITLEGRPGAVQSLEAVPLGQSAFWLSWKPPLKPNGKLTGYKIYYEEVRGTRLEPKRDREPHISDPSITSVKLAGLDKDTKYRLHIRATTKAGEGDDYYIEEKTLEHSPIAPDIPNFKCEKVATDTGYGAVKVKWHPSGPRAGSHFFAKYRKKGEPNWETTKHEVNEDHLIIRPLDPDSTYELRVGAVDGEYVTESQSQFVEINDIEGPIIVPSKTVATAGWFIGMILAIAFLILILSIICIIKRNRGGKYDVHDRELANGRRDFDDGGFHEYSQPLDNKSQGRQSTSSNLTKPGPESDTDSMAEYGEGDTDGMNEDGSFIGQYGKKGKQPESNSQAFATLV